MLNPETDDLPNKKEARILQVRLNDFLAELVERASTDQGIDMETFVLMAIAKEAQRVIGVNCYHVLTPEDAEVLFNDEDKPIPPRLIKSAAEYRRRVVSVAD